LRGWKTIGEDDRRSEPAEMGDELESARVEAIGERVVDQEARQRQQPVRGGSAPFHFGAVALQRAEVVGITELVARRVEDRPVAVGTGRAELALEMQAQLGDDSVVVEQRVVEVEQEDEVGTHDSSAVMECCGPFAALRMTAARMGSGRSPAPGHASRQRRR
jgi:hypothetical protein